MILVNGNEVEFKTFPNGETLVNEKSIDSDIYSVAHVTLKYENDSDLIKLLFVKKHLDSIKRGENVQLQITYMPYSRMDRSENNSVFTLKYVANFINSLEFSSVEVIEPHSDVTAALLNNSFSRYINFELLPSVMGEIDFNKDRDYLMFPDAGASKRYQSLKGFKQLIGHKHRDFQTGDIKSLNVIGDVDSTDGKVLIVDDLSSYGGTFYYSANALRDLGFNEVYLLIAHCENSIHEGKLLNDNSPINRIFTTDSILTIQSPKIKVFEINK